MYLSEDEKALNKKTILLLSPQPWQGFKVSKHHYALALANRGNHIFFLDPIFTSVGFSVSLTPVQESERITVIRYHTLISYWFRFHFPCVFYFFLNLQLRRIQSRIGPIDIVWDFDNHLFRDYNNFENSFKIFHPVDKTNKYCLSKKPDIFFSVSPSILKPFESSQKPKIVLPHGVNDLFAAHAYNALNAPFHPKIKAKTAGYVGNLKHPAVDRANLLKMVGENPGLLFHFFGHFNLEPLENDGYLMDFVQALTTAPNVILHGFADQATVLAFSEHIDVFLACYRRTPNYDSDNSHKILEYLATGKPVVSSYLSVYQNSDYLCMPEENEGNDALWALLKNVADNYAEFQTPEKRRKRLEFALKNTYQNHVDTIERHIKEALFHCGQ